MNANTIGGIGAVLAAVVLLVAYFREWGYRRGFKDGHTAGENDAWMSFVVMERQVDEERQKIWRTEE
jgi:hypothetical protein